MMRGSQIRSNLENREILTRRILDRRTGRHDPIARCLFRSGGPDAQSGSSAWSKQQLTTVTSALDSGESGTRL